MSLKGNGVSSVWAAEEFREADFRDERLKSRLIQLADRLAESPESPINQACHDWAETKGAYRNTFEEAVEKLLSRYLTVMSIIAWRIFWIKLIARENPDLPCDEVLSAEE